MTDPVVIEPAMMRSIGDCGIVCLKMLLGVSYADVFRACPRGNPLVNGLGTRQIMNIAARLRKPLRIVRDFEEDAVGIIIMAHSKDEGHAAMYGKGTIYDPAQGEWWLDVDAYLKHRSYTICGLLVRA